MKKKRKETGLDVHRVDFESRPDMLNLDVGLREILKVPKGEMEKREAEWQALRQQKQKES